MTWKRDDRVTESLRTLRALEKKHAGTREGERATLLRVLKENPSCTLVDAAVRLGRSRPTVQRWWDTYRRRGLDAMIQVPRKSGGRRARLSDQQLAMLRRKVNDEGVRNVSVLRSWLKREFDVEYSRQGVQYLLKTKMEEVPIRARVPEPMSRPAVRCVPEREQRDRSPERNERDAPDSALHFSKAAIEFLNSIPTTHDVLEWIVKFRERLRALLGDVDRISIAVNIDCDLRDSFNHKKVITVTQISDGSKRNAVATTLYDQSPSRRMRDNLMKMEFPFHCYRDPETFEYFLGRHAYVGAIFLWREKSKSAISRKTLQTMQELESFIVFLLTDIVARHKYSDATVDSQFALSLGGMFSDAKLSEREAQVVTLQLFGHTYDQIADRLSLSINTVRKHVASIHRKTGTHSFTELFAKYFTPSLGF